MNTCPKCNRDLESVSGDFGAGVYHPDGTQETRYEEGLYCAHCEVTYDPADLEEDEPSNYDPDHLNPAEGGNKASDDYW